MKNIISIDVEQWFHRPILTKHIRNLYIDSEHILKSINVILNIFKKYKKRTTFFILGEVAENVPEIIEIILNDGHEIAYHGYSHLPLSKIGEERFEREVNKGVKIIKKITKVKIKGFRSPMFSLNKDTVWALKILKKYDFKYDSSIFPVQTPLYGSKDAPIFPYYPSFKDPTKEDINQGNIIELPILTRNIFNIRLPAGGGFYSRLFGVRFILESIRKINKKGYPAICYFHPWEICGFPKIDMPFFSKFYAYYGIPCIDIFEKIVKSINIVTAIDTIENY